jgi:hypothetical protein
MADERREGDRGGGIHIGRRSDFRLRNFRLSFDTTTGELVDSSIVPELRTDIFDDWFRIAGRASDESEAARRDAIDAPLADDEGFANALQREFEAAMIGITASAIALDAFFASVVEHAPDARVSADSRDATIFETLKRAFVLSGEQQSEAREPLRTIFRFRDEAVHPPATWRAPVLHPAFNLRMEQRFVMFRAENAVTAHLFASELIAACVRNPKKKYAALVAWCEPLTEAVPEPQPHPEPERLE